MIKDHEWFILPNDKALKQAVDRTIKHTKKTDAKAVDYQNYLLETAFKFIDKYDLAIDAGANYGIFSYHLNNKFQKVHAFEVETDVRECLKKNVEKFDLKNVIVHDCGLGEKEKFVSVNYIKNSFGTYITPNQQDGNFLIRTIDSFELQNCDFIKIDCEGYEPFILEGAENTIKNFKPVVLMEDKNLGSKYYGLENRLNVRILENWGYEIVHQWPKDCIMKFKG